MVALVKSFPRCQGLKNTREWNLPSKLLCSLAFLSEGRRCLGKGARGHLPLSFLQVFQSPYSTKLFPVICGKRPGFTETVPQNNCS